MWTFVHSIAAIAENLKANIRNFSGSLFLAVQKTFWKTFDMTAAELLTLARAYSEATGLALTTIGVKACASANSRGGNDKIFVRLAEGRGCNSKTIDRAARWFALNWPENIDWPLSVPRACEAAE
jgi:hypothetical protein